VKIRRGVGEIFIPVVEALPTTVPPKYILMAIYVAWLPRTLIKKRRKKVHG